MLAWGASGSGFNSRRPDHKNLFLHMPTKAKKEDLKNVLKLVLEFKNFDHPKVIEQTEVDRIEKNLEDILDLGHTQILLLVEDSEVIGYATAVVYDSVTDCEKNVYIDELFISSNYQNKGLGSKFLEEIKNWCREQNATKMKLVTRSDNSRAQYFYEKNLGIKKDKINYTFEL